MTPSLEVIATQVPGTVATVQVLLAAGANVRDKNAEAETALVIVGKRTDSQANEVRTFLKKYGAVEWPDGLNPTLTSPKVAA